MVLPKLMKCSIFQFLNLILNGHIMENFEGSVNLTLKYFVRIMLHHSSVVKTNLYAYICLSYRPKFIKYPIFPYQTPFSNAHEIK